MLLFKGRKIKDQDDQDLNSHRTLNPLATSPQHEMQKFIKYELKLGHSVFLISTLFLLHSQYPILIPLKTQGQSETFFQYKIFTQNLF